MSATPDDDDEGFERFVHEATGGAPVSRGELWQWREEWDERCRDGGDVEKE